MSFRRTEDTTSSSPRPLRGSENGSGSPLSRREFVDLAGRCALLSAGTGLLAGVPATRPAAASVVVKGLVGSRKASYFTPLDNGGVRCDLCPHGCSIEAGSRGRCGVRENRDGALWSRVYGNPCAVNIDPIEKKPFFHVLPGSKTLSLATAGCNLTCKSCLNWEASQARPEETFNYDLPPAEAAARAEQYGCASIASSYVEPVVFVEYMLDIARSSRDRALLHLMHSAGFINPAPLEEICPLLDAACIDLKGFSEDFYRDLVGGGLQPVLETLRQLARRGVHTEIVNLLIPGRNDDPATLRTMCRWIARQIGREVPIHFYRFYPRYLLKNVPPTPVAALETARAIAMEEGLHFAYIANVPEHPGMHTYCPGCGELLIERVGFITRVAALEDGSCGRCGRPIPGIWKRRAPAAPA